MDSSVLHPEFLVSDRNMWGSVTFWSMLGDSKRVCPSAAGSVGAVDRAGRRGRSGMSTGSRDVQVVDDSDGKWWRRGSSVVVSGLGGSRRDLAVVGM